MSYMGMDVPQKVPLNEQGFCSCCETENIELFGNKCEHGTCETCSQICGHCMEPVCVRTACSIPLECTKCGQDMISCNSCAYDDNGSLKMCDVCGDGDMTIHSQFAIDYGAV
mmetsp:Transcript_7549/g.28376  ORF Transcript_7549/g.28376 Transcript_7549/m.28376 type:complete len:112 (+) Transcript_7549:3-338(+)